MYCFVFVLEFLSVYNTQGSLCTILWRESLKHPIGFILYTNMMILSTITNLIDSTYFVTILPATCTIKCVWGNCIIVHKMYKSIWFSNLENIEKCVLPFFKHHILCRFWYYNLARVHWLGLLVVRIQSGANTFYHFYIASIAPYRHKVELKTHARGGLQRIWSAHSFLPTGRHPAEPAALISVVFPFY